VLRAAAVVAAAVAGAHHVPTVVANIALLQMDSSSNSRRLVMIDLVKCSCQLVELFHGMFLALRSEIASRLPS